MMHTAKHARRFTCLVLDQQLEVLDVFAVDVAGITGEGEVGSESRTCRNNIRGYIPRAGIAASGGIGGECCYVTLG